MSVCPFGGSPGQWRRDLNPQARPPSRGFRVIPGAVWWTLVFWPWRLYLVARAEGRAGVTPPLLAPFGSRGVLFTDQESLQGIQGASDFAKRVGLSRWAQTECHLFGCAIVEFEAPSSSRLPHPAVTSCQRGLTVGWAREWSTQMTNVQLVATMRVVYIDVSQSGPRCFEIPL